LEEEAGQGIKQNRIGKESREMGTEGKASRNVKWLMSMQTLKQIFF
jgi:hypothetical protein